MEGEVANNLDGTSKIELWACLPSRPKLDV